MTVSSGATAARRRALRTRSRRRRPWRPTADGDASDRGAAQGALHTWPGAGPCLPVAAARSRSSVTGRQTDDTSKRVMHDTNAHALRTGPKELPTPRNQPPQSASPPTERNTNSSATTAAMCGIGRPAVLACPTSTCPCCRWRAGFAMNLALQPQGGSACY